MVENHSITLDVLFRAIADPTRRAMIARLAREPRTVGELAEPFEISLAAASKHIQVLERAGLVTRTVQGRTHTVRLQAEPLRAGMEWMRRYEKFWNDRLDALEQQLLADAARATAPRQRSAADAASSQPVPTAGPQSPESRIPHPSLPSSPALPSSPTSLARDEIPSRRGPRIVPPHERSSRRNTGRKGS